MLNAKKIAYPAIGISLLIIASQISIKLPSTPVNLTLQTLIIPLLGLIFKGKNWLIICGYLFLGAIGLPVFSNFSGGISKLLGPSGGFLFGFLILAYIIGIFNKNRFHFILGLLIGNLLLYLCGILWLKLYLKLDIFRALRLGLFPFLIGDIIKIFILYFLYPHVQANFKNIQF